MEETHQPKESSVSLQQMCEYFQAWLQSLDGCGEANEKRFIECCWRGLFRPEFRRFDLRHHVDSFSEPYH
jgi:hypothetical protein